MTLEASVASLELALLVARESLAAVQLTVVEDVPSGDVALVDRLSDQLDDASAESEGAARLASEVGEAVTPPVDVDLAGRNLAGCQQELLHMTRRLTLELVDPNLFSALASLGRSRPGEWAAWSRTVCGGLLACREPLLAVGEALASCWIELFERAAAGGVSVQAIGQQITVPEPVAVVEGFP